MMSQHPLKQFLAPYARAVGSPWHTSPCPRDLRKYPQLRDHCPGGGGLRLSD